MVDYLRFRILLKVFIFFVVFNTLVMSSLMLLCAGCSYLSPSMKDIVESNMYVDIALSIIVINGKLQLMLLVVSIIALMFVSAFFGDAIVCVKKNQKLLASIPGINDCSLVGLFFVYALSLFFYHASYFYDLYNRWEQNSFWHLMGFFVSVLLAWAFYMGYRYAVKRNR